jgi:hypothetical protein
MFDFRAERFDEIHEAEAEFYSHAEPAADVAAAPIVQPGFQLPAKVWAMMIGCYAVFLGGMAALVAGSGYAMFMVVISILYTLVFFTTSTLLANLAGEQDKSPLDRGQALPTWCGPMSSGAVYGQVLIVPAGIALFGTAVAVIGALTA